MILCLIANSVPGVTGLTNPDVALSLPSLQRVQRDMQKQNFVLKHKTAPFMLMFLHKCAQMLC